MLVMSVRQSFRVVCSTVRNASFGFEVLRQDPVFMWGCLRTRVLEHRLHKAGDAVVADVVFVVALVRIMHAEGSARFVIMIVVVIGVVGIAGWRIIMVIIVIIAVVNVVIIVVLIRDPLERLRAAVFIDIVLHHVAVRVKRHRLAALPLVDGARARAVESSRDKGWTHR